MYGYRAEEVIGKDISILMPEGHGEERQQVLDRVSRGESVSQLETVSIRKNGSPIDVVITVSPIKNRIGEVVGIATIARDITVRKRAEETIRRSEEKYRLLVANIPDVVWTTDDTGECVFITANIEKIDGDTPEEIQGSGRWLSRVHPDDVEGVRQAYRLLLATGQMFVAEYRLQRKDGIWIWFQAKAVSSYEKDGKRFTVGIGSDITARKQTEEELKAATQAARGCKPAKKSVPGQHEPRNTDPNERYPGHDIAGNGHVRSGVSGKNI